MVECPECGGERLQVFARGDFARARRCERCSPRGGCCDDGFVVARDERGQLVARPCPTCRAVDRRVELFDRAKLPARYADATLASFRPLTGLREAAKDAFLFAREFEPGRPGLLYYGPVGRGKTHLVVGILRYLLVHRGVEARFVEFMHLLSDLRATFDGGNSEAVMQPLVDVPVLAVDELGKGRSAARTNQFATPEVSEWVQGVLDQLISRRYNAKRTTLFTTNYYPGPPVEGQQSLEDRVGARIYSRLAEMCQPVHVNTPEDYRLRGGPA